MDLIKSEYKKTILENLETICMSLNELGINDINNLDLNELKILNNEVNNEYNEFFGIK